MLEKHEIASDERDIPEGWPRPYYRLSGSPQRKYAQWSSDLAAAQITACNSDRTYMGGEHHLCSSCGVQMSKGLIFDSLPLIEKGQKTPITVTYQTGGGDEWGARTVSVNLQDLEAADTHYGSPICFRCAIFAAKHCPYLAALHEPFGDEFTWFVTTSGQDYREFDESSGLEVIDPDSLPRITTGEVRAAIQRGELHLTGLSAKDFEGTKRPAIRDESGYFMRDAQRDPTQEGNLV